MGIINTGSFPKALWEGVNAWFGQKYDRHDKEFNKLFDTYNSSKNSEEDVQAVSFGLSTLKPEGSAISYDTMNQGFTKRYTHLVYANGYVVTEEEQEDNLYEQLAMARTGLLAWSAAETQETVAALVYDRAFNSSYTGGDSKELCATDHANSVGGGTFSNELNPAAQLSEQSLEDLVIQIGQAENDRGLKINLKPKSLVIPINLQFEASRILKSTLQANSAENNINVLKSMGVIPEIVVSHYLSDANNFFIRTNVDNGMKRFVRRAVRLKNDNDFDTGNLKASITFRESYGWSDPRSLYGSAPA